MSKQKKFINREKIKSLKQDKFSYQISIKQVPSNKWIKWLFAFIIAVITFIAFSPALKNEFTNWDDRYYIVENSTLSLPIFESAKYFFSHFFMSNYSPLTMIIYTIEYHFSGLNPGLYHLVNILIHLLNVLLVFWFIYLLSGKKTEIAVIVSLLFGIHPMHVESVAWVAELKDVLYTFFFLGGLISYYKYIEKQKAKTEKQKGKIWLLVFSFFLFILSVLSKPAAVIFPLVMLLLDFYIKRKSGIHIWIEKLPFFLVSILMGIVTIKAQQAHAIQLSYSIFQTLLFASWALLNYIIKLVVPLNLSAFYPYPRFIEGHIPYIFYFTPVIVLLLFYGLYRTLKYSSLIVFGFLFFLINIALVLQVLSVGAAIIADRYTYIPYIGLFFIIANGINKIHNSKLKSFSYFVICFISLVLGFMTYARCGIWKNSEILWTDVLSKYPDNDIALNNKGEVLCQNGQYQEAKELFLKSVQSNPDYGKAYTNLAVCYDYLHDYDNALKSINIGLKYAPDDYKVLNNKCVILVEKGEYKEALKYGIKALQLKPDFISANISLAQCYKGLHDYDNALKNIDIVLKYSPEEYASLNTKGCILYAQGKYNDAISVFKDALKQNSQFVDGYLNTGNCFYMLHDYDNAILYWKKSLDYKPANASVYKKLSLAYKGKGYNASVELYSAKAKELENRK